MSDSGTSKPDLPGNTPRTAYVLDHDSKILSEIGTLLRSRGVLAKCFRQPEQLLAAPIPNGPACLILDHHQPDNGAGGLDIHRNMVRSGWIHPVIYLSSCSEVRTVVSAMRNGAIDYLIKPCDPDDLMQAILNALRHSEEKLRKSICREKAEMQVQCLTKRERKVVEMVLSGMLNKEIAVRMNLSLVTVKVYRGRAMKKLGAGNVAELVQIASMGGITPG